MPKWQNFAKSGHTGWGIRQTDKQKIGKNPFVSFREEAGGGDKSLSSRPHICWFNIFIKAAKQKNLLQGKVRAGGKGGRGGKGVAVASRRKVTAGRTG